MDVKAEVVLLIFTLNCVTLILLGQDMIRYRLCQDQFADYPACITTKVTTTPDPINLDNKIDNTTATITTAITPTTTATTITISNNTIPVSVTSTSPTTSTTAIITTTFSFFITNLVPLQTQSPPPPPPPLPPLQNQQQFSPQHVPHQLLALPPLPINERENAPLTPSSPLPPPSPSPLPGSVDLNFNSGRYGNGIDDDDDKKDDLTKEVKTFGLIIIATFVSTSVASSQVLGRWIDRWSCRTLALLPLTGVVAWGVCGLLVSCTPSLPLYLWLVGTALGGSSGGFVTLKVAATIYAVRAAPQWDSTVRLALLQAAASIGVLIAYLGLYFLAADPQV